MIDNESQHIEFIQKMISDLGDDPTREGLIKTPKRFLDAMHFLTSGYRTNIEELVNDAIFNEACDEMILIRDIEFHSICEHHLQPFYGRCSVAYLPQGRIIGLSKIPRLVNAFARRLQVQERMTQQIGEALFHYLKPRGVGVVIEAYHSCMMMRGVEKQNALTVTSGLQGAFKEPATRQEFMSLLQNRKH